MIEFITTYFHFITYGFEAFAAVTGILLFKKYKNTATKYFIYFLIYIAFVEFVGASLIFLNNVIPIKFMRTIGVRTTNWYNLFWMFGSILFVLKYYHNLLNLIYSKTIIKITSIVFVAIFLLHIVFNSQDFLQTHPPIYSLLGAFSTFICVALYFLELIKNESIINMFKHFGFYASVGLFLWWLVITPILFYDIYNTKADLDFANLKRRVFLFANIFMYTCFAIGLIVSKPQPEND